MYSKPESAAERRAGAAGSAGLQNARSAVRSAALVQGVGDLFINENPTHEDGQGSEDGANSSHDGRAKVEAKMGRQASGYVGSNTVSVDWKKAGLGPRAEGPQPTKRDPATKSEVSSSEDASETSSVWTVDEPPGTRRNPGLDYEVWRSGYWLGGGEICYMEARDARQQREQNDARVAGASLPGNLQVAVHSIVMDGAGDVVLNAVVARALKAMGVQAVPFLAVDVIRDSDEGQDAYQNKVRDRIGSIRRLLHDIGHDAFLAEDFDRVTKAVDPFRFRVGVSTLLVQPELPGQMSLGEMYTETPKASSLRFGLNPSDLGIVVDEELLAMGSEPLEARRRRLHSLEDIALRGKIGRKDMMSRHVFQCYPQTTFGPTGVIDGGSFLLASIWASVARAKEAGATGLDVFLPDAGPIASMIHELEGLHGPIGSIEIHSDGVDARKLRLEESGLPIRIFAGRLCEHDLRVVRANADMVLASGDNTIMASFCQPAVPVFELQEKKSGVIGGLLDMAHDPGAGLSAGERQAVFAHLAHVSELNRLMRSEDYLVDCLPFLEKFMRAASDPALRPAYDKLRAFVLQTRGFVPGRPGHMQNWMKARLFEGVRQRKAVRRPALS